MFSSLPPGRVLAVGALLLAAAAAAPALASSPPAADAPPACGRTSAPLAVTGGTVTWCEITLDGQPGGRLTFKNTGRAHANLSLVLYDCDGGTAPNVDAAACSKSLAGTYNVIWREVKSKESVSTDFQLTNKNAQVWWTADKVSQATDLKLLGTPWNA